MDKHAFDAKHRFHVNLLNELDDYAHVDETFVEPEPEEFKSKVGITGFEMAKFDNCSVGTLASLAS